MKQTLRQCGPRFSIPCESIATLVPKNSRGHYVCQFGEARVRSCGKEQRSLILFLLRDCTTTVAVYVYGSSHFILKCTYEYVSSFLEYSVISESNQLGKSLDVQVALVGQAGGT